MNAYQMMTRIAAALKKGESVTVNCSYARGRTLIETYTVSKDGIEYQGHSWGGRGTVRQIYAQRCLNNA